MKREVHVGDIVIFHDARGKAHNALVNGVWSETCLNLVLVSDDETRQDTYGRQIERQTSVTHCEVSGVHGNNWRLPSEPEPKYTPPQEV